MPPKQKTIRYATSMKVLGLPLLSIAYGPDTSKGEAKGWARGIIAMGDIATGVVALGGLAGGGIAVGGISLGAISIGGVGLGGLVIGGVAVGLISLGGVAVGQYAKGGSAVGQYVISPKHCDPDAAKVFSMLYLQGTKPAAKDEAKPAEPDKKQDTKPVDQSNTESDKTPVDADPDPKN